MNQPPFNTEIWMVPLSAYAADETLAPAMAVRAMRPARNKDETRMVVLLEDRIGVGCAESATRNRGTLAQSTKTRIVPRARKGGNTSRRRVAPLPPDTARRGPPF